MHPVEFGRVDAGIVETTVLERARDRFWPTGFAGTSIDDVVAATGLGKGSLYGAFGDKRQLYLRVFDRYCTEVTEATVRSLDGPDDGAYARLRAHVLAVADATGRDTEHLGCLLANGTAELAGQDSAVADRARRTFEALEDALVECIQQAQRHGAIDPAANARRHGRLLLAVLRGIEALGKANTDKRSLRSIAEAFRALETANQDNQVVLDPRSLVVGVLQGAKEAPNLGAMSALHAFGSLALHV